MVAGKMLFKGCVYVLLLVSAGCGSLDTPQVSASGATVADMRIEAHQSAIESWRAARHERLMRADGWLTLVGLEWLKDGQNRIGSATDNDIQLPGGPAYWGSVFLEDDRLRFLASDSENVKVNGEALTQADLVPDTEGKPTIISSENISFYVIFRESFALRIKDSRANALVNFKGVESFPITESWRVEGPYHKS